MEIFENLESNVRSYCRALPVMFQSGQAHLIYDETGKGYIDFFSAAGALNYGHNPALIVESVITYMRANGLVTSLDMYTTAKKDFLFTFDQLILKPRNLNYVVQFTGPTGTNAVEAALKIARLNTGRSNVVAFTNGYHGVSLGSLAVTGARDKRQGAGQPLNNVSRFPFDDYLTSVNGLDLLEHMLDDPSSGLDTPAAIIFETIQGEGGINAASPEWLKRLEQIARDRKIFLIVDDIQAGCGRTGSFFSFENFNITPDIIVLSKSISGLGLPMSLVLLKKEMDIWLPGQHNGTFRGNNLAFVAAKTAIDHYWANRTFEIELSSTISLLDDLLNVVSRKYEHHGCVLKGRGMLRGLRFENSKITNLIQKQALELGLLIETCGPNDEVVKIMPPLTIDAAGLAKGVNILDEAISFSTCKYGKIDSRRYLSSLNLKEESKC